MNEKQNKRLLAIFSLAILVLGVFGTFIIAIFNPVIAMVFAVIATILTLTFGIMSWKEKLARVAVIIIITFSILAVLSSIYLFVDFSEKMLERKELEQKEMSKKNENDSIMNIKLYQNKMNKNEHFSQDYETPDSFKHLTKIGVDGVWGVFVFVGPNPDTNVAQIRIEDGFFEYDYLKPVCITKINKNENEKYLIGFSEGPSDDPSFEFYKIVNNQYVYMFGISGLQLFIPGNGNIYVSGDANNMFNKRIKYRFQNDTIVEVKQPYYYVGLKTLTSKSIKLYSDRNCSKVLATLPANSEIEVVAAGMSIEKTDYYFLIKTSFGLLGWWKLDDYYSQTIKGLYFHGD